MKRIVIDTNVFVSSYYGGNALRIIQQWHNREFVLCVSPPIVEEYIEVLLRLGLTNSTKLEELISLFRTGEHSIFTLNTPSISVCSDPDDDKFIECAVALKAEVIVTGDKALQSIENYFGIAILNPKQFLDTQ